jgi:lysozyme family protein
MAEFSLAIGYVLVNEGIDSDHPADTGGRTRYGITEAVAKSHGLDVRTLSLANAKEIYRLDYWRFDGVTDQRVATKCLDIVVNCGITGGVKVIQRAVGANPDGILGPKTLAGLNDNPAEMILERLSMAVADRYVDIVTRDASQLCFLKGWIRRAIRRP